MGPDGNRRDVGGRPSAGGSLRADAAKPAIFSDLDGGVPTRVRRDASECGAGARLHSADVPGSREPVGAPDHPEPSPGNISGPEGARDLSVAFQTSGVGDPGAAHDLSDRSLANAARRYLKLRRERSNGLSEAIFSDPAWDMLLDLFVAKKEHRRITKSSAYLASGVSAGTAHRHALKLVEAGWVRQYLDPVDRRRIYIEIEEIAAERVARWLALAFCTV